jgi:hypothetical protein
LPSRKSTLHQMGAWVITASGQRRSARRTGAKGRYLLAGLCNMDGLAFMEQEKMKPGSSDLHKQKRPVAGAHGPWK